MMTNESGRTLRNKTFDSEPILNARNEEKIYLCSNLKFDFELKKWTDNKQGLQKNSPIGDRSWRRKLETSNSQISRL